MNRPGQFITVRTMADWDQADLAAASGVSLGTVQSLETEDVRNTLFTNIVAIVDALQSGVSSLLVVLSATL